jgi:hypothetical protein
MRRGSLFAPLLLIGLGALFLARNVLPDLPLIDYLAKYWPFLLIIWGTLRLLEVVYWHSTGKPLPAAGISGGEWTLVFFLVIFGVSLHAARGFYNWLPRERLTFGGLDMFGESFDYPINAEKPASKTVKITLEAFRGNAHIVGADVQTVKVVGHSSIRSLEQDGANRANDAAVYEITGEPDQLTLRANQDRFNGPQRITAELEITVPKGASIDARGRNGDFDINNIDGSVDINSDNAGVRLENIGGDARIELRRSDIIRAINMKGGVQLKGRGDDVDLENVQGQVTINGAYTGSIELHNLSKLVHYTGTQTEYEIAQIPGEVRSTRGDFVGNKLVGPIRLTGRSRDVRISNFTNALDLTIDRGDITLLPGAAPLPRMDIHSKSGDIELGLPAASKFDLTATTGRGELSNEFGSPLSTDQGPHGGGTIRGGNGGPAVNLHVDRGGITVRRASADEAAFVPPPMPDRPAVPERPPYVELPPPGPGATRVPSPPAPPKPLQRIEQ